MRWCLHHRREDQLDDRRKSRVFDVLEKIDIMRRLRQIPLAFVGQTDEQFVDQRVTKTIGLRADEMRLGFTLIARRRRRRRRR